MDRVLITGAAGTVGRALRQGLQDRVGALRLLDVVLRPHPGNQRRWHLQRLRGRPQAGLRSGGVHQQPPRHWLLRRRRAHQPRDAGPAGQLLWGRQGVCGEPWRLYADKHGLQVVCVRIGTFAERPTTPRHLSTWLSPGDAVELFWRCLVTPDIGFTVVYGASANQRGWWDPGPVERLGYRPVDDAEKWASEVNGTDVDPTESGEGPQGGSYAR